MPPSMRLTQPRSALRGCLIAFIIATSALLIVIAGAIAFMGPIGALWNSSTVAADHTVTFRVTTNAKTAVSYGTNGALLNETVTGTWTKDAAVTGAQSVTMALIVDGGAPATATATCEIVVDGKSKDTATLTGPSAVGACSAST